MPMSVENISHLAGAAAQSRDGCPRVTPPGEGGFGIYVHYPWCSSKCPYCAFVSRPMGRDSGRDKAYTDALLAELALQASRFSMLSLKSIFFGGGTPSLWDPAQLARFMDGVRNLYPKEFSNRELVEVSMEVNPASVTGYSLRPRLEELSKAGVNRVSIGVQSFDDNVLAGLARIHDGAGALAAIYAARDAGFKRISIDLIVGSPGQDRQSLVRDLEIVNSLDGIIEHVSAYGMTMEEGTPFEKQYLAGTLSLPDEDEQADLLQLLNRRLHSYGFERYEVSNYAKPGGRCRHNMLYWTGAPYLGLGVAAHSHLPGRRWEGASPIGHTTSWPVTNRWAGGSDPEQYVSGMVRGVPQYAFQEEIADRCSQFGEQIMTGLRLGDGVDLDRLCDYYGVSVDMGVIGVLCRDGYLAWGNGRNRELVDMVTGSNAAHTMLRLGEKGWMVADEIILRICSSVREASCP